MKKIFWLILLMLPFAASAQEMDVSKVDDGVDRAAFNIGGISEFKRLFEQEMIYPEKALKENKSGTVELGFLVMKDGTPANIKVLRSVSPEIDAEALRIFRMLLWKPMIYRGDAVNTLSTLKFDFKASKYEKLCKKRGYTSVPYPYQPADTSLTIHTKPEQMPVHPQGPYAMQDLIAKSIRYPHPAAVQNLQGTVLLSFIVEPSGMMSNIYVEKGVGGGCSEEAIRVLKMLKWQPGYNNGKAVRTKMTLPIEFNLANAFKDNSSSEQGR
jgi:TonB family protein